MSYDRSQVQQTGEYTHGYGRPTHFASAMPAIVEATEPDLDKIERGEEVQPRATGDERLILLMNSWEQRDEAWIAKTFDAAGDDAIQSFLERHIADIEPNKARRLTEYLRKMEGWSEAFQESLRGEADAPYASTHLAEMLKKKVVPVIREVLGASRRVKASRGGKDPVPGPHNEAGQRSERTETTDRTPYRGAYPADAGVRAI